MPTVGRQIFYWTDYNDKGWGTMPVPGIWELHGYGQPQYVNIGYGWREDFKSNPPEVPVEKNHVGSYRRTIDIPADWKGRDIIAHFGSVTSNMYLWVNGRFVGYSEDSKLEPEFDITGFVTPGNRPLLPFRCFAGATDRIWRIRISGDYAVWRATAICYPGLNRPRFPI